MKKVDIVVEMLKVLGYSWYNVKISSVFKVENF